MAEMTPQQVNMLNQQMRTQPWYQSFFQQRGLDPNHVKLNDAQRAQLAQEAARNGMALPPHYIIDPAGNANTQHGFAGQPTWLKALEIGGAAGAGAFFGGPALMGLLGNGAAPGAALGAGEASTTLGATGGMIPGLGTIGGELSTTLGATGGLIPGLNVAGSNIAGTAAKTGGSALGKFLGGAADAGKVVGGVAEAEATNRDNKARNTQAYDRLALSAAENRRTDESDAMRKLAIAGYLGQGGSKYEPASIQLNGQTRTLPTFAGIAPPPISDAQKQGASTLEAQMLARLQPGGSWKPTDPDYLDRGKLEKATNYGGMILTGLGAAKNLFGF